MKSIPKVCYFYWGGSGSMPMLMIFTVISFHRLNPDWKIILYRTIQRDEDLGKDLYSYHYTGKDYYYMLEEMDFIEIRIFDVLEFGIKKDIHSICGSDMFRTKVLYENGGMYSDLDIIWLKPMSEFVNVDCIGNPNDFECNVSFYKQTSGHHTSSFLIAEKGSLFLKSVIEDQNKVKPPYKDCSFSTFMLDKKYPVLDDIISKYPRILALKYETIFPYSIFNIQQLWTENDLTPLKNKNVMCVHWFNGHPLSREYTNNGFDTDCSMTSILKQEGYI